LRVCLNPLRRLKRLRLLNPRRPLRLLNLLRPTEAPNFQPHQHHRSPQVRPVFQLSKDQLEQAFQWLADPLPSAPPKELEPLSQYEWFLLSRMLDALLQEKDNSPLQ